MNTANELHYYSDLRMRSRKPEIAVDLNLMELRVDRKALVRYSLFLSSSQHILDSISDTKLLFAK